MRGKLLIISISLLSLFFYSCSEDDIATTGTVEVINQSDLSIIVRITEASGNSDSKLIESDETKDFGEYSPGVIKCTYRLAGDEFNNEDLQGTLKAGEVLTFTYE